MTKIGGVSITDDLRLSIGAEAVQLRPAQGLRVVETLLRASTRMMMAEEAARPAARPARAATGKLSSHS